MEFVNRTFLGYVPGLLRGIHPPQNPPGPGSTAGVRENRYQFTRGGSQVIWRLAKIEAHAEFALPGQQCYAIGYYSDLDPAPEDFSIQTPGTGRWIHRDPQLIDERGTAGPDVLEITPNGGRWITIRVASGTPPTRWALWGRLNEEGGTLPIG